MTSRAGEEGGGGGGGVGGGDWARLHRGQRKMQETGRVRVRKSVDYNERLLAAICTGYRRL